MRVGSIVLAVAGRDMGGYFVVTKIEEDRIYIADGRRRKLENPKAKNIIHLSDTGQFLPQETITGNKKLKTLLSGHNQRKENDS